MITLLMCWMSLRERSCVYTKQYSNCKSMTRRIAPWDDVLRAMAVLMASRIAPGELLLVMHIYHLHEYLHACLVISRINT